MSDSLLYDAVFVLVRLVEAAGALVIFMGAAIGFVRFVSAALRRRIERFTPIRLDIGRFLALGLEFQLASDLLRTAVAPSFAEIGKLAAVAAIRTALNFFLGLEVRRERQEVEQRSRASAEANATPTQAGTMDERDGRANSALPGRESQP